MDERISADEIKRIRGKYGLSQQSFARILGIGEASMARYENGRMPSRANANLIRAANHPRFMAECLDRAGGEIPLSQRSHAEKIIYSLLELDEGGELVGVDEIYALSLDQEVLNEKAAEMLAELSRLLLRAEEESDEVGKAVYSDALSLLAQAKREIVYSENRSFNGLAEIRGRIDMVSRLVDRRNRVVA